MRHNRRITIPITGRLSLLLLPILLIPGGITAANAQITNTWTGSGTNDNWSNIANWDTNGVPISGSTTGLDFTGSAAISNNDLGAFTLNLMQFDMTADFTVSGSALNFAANTIDANNIIDPTLTQDTAFGVTVNNDITLSNNLTVKLAGSGLLNLTGQVSGAGSLTIAGSNASYTTLLSNSNNSYTGGTIIAGGTLQLGADNALPNGQNLQLIGRVNGTITDATLDLNGHAATVGAITFGDGDFNPSSGNMVITDSSSGATGQLTLNGSILFNGSGNADPAQINSNLVLAAGQHTVDLASTGNISNNYYDLIFAGKISGSGGLDMGTTSSPPLGTPILSVVLMNSNTNYSGATNLYQNDLFLGQSNALPAQSAVSIANSANLYLYIDTNRTQTGITAGSYNQTIGSLGDIGSSGGTVFLGAATLTVGANNASTTFNGTIQDSDQTLSNASDSAVGGSLVKVGAGTLTLGGANTYTGSTTIDAGTLQSGIMNALPTTTNLTLNGGNFNLNDNSQTLTKVTNSGGNVLVQGGTNAALTLFGPYTQSAGTTQVLSGGNLTVAGAYTQSGGTTQIDATLNITPGKNLALTGGELVGTGTISNATTSGTITVTNSGGTLHPGDLLPSITPGTLTIQGNYTQQSGGAMEIDLSSSGTGMLTDNLAGTTTTLGGTLDVKLLNGFAPTVGEQFNFLKYSALSGTFSSIVGLDPGYAYSTSFANGNGTLTVTAAVPEVSTLLSAALMLGTGGALIRRQRRSMQPSIPCNRRVGRG